MDGKLRENNNGKSSERYYMQKTRGSAKVEGKYRNNIWQKS